MGVTGATGSLNTGLPKLLARIKKYSGNVPAAIGFGVSTREHFLSVASIADGVVIGSQIITTLSEAAPGDRARAAEEYCAAVCGRRNSPSDGLNGSIDTVEVNGTSHTNGEKAEVLHKLEEMVSAEGGDPELFSARFGEFGGSYAPESLMRCLSELEVGFDKIRNDPDFWAEMRSYYPYIGRPGHMHLADRLTEHAGGANIWLKREDLNHTGSHKINSALGQILLARRLGKTEIIAQTGAGMHGVATATVCAKFNMKCTIFMGEVGPQPQVPNKCHVKNI